jgi:lambda repressor-like predicted transcriptional regulator
MHPAQIQAALKMRGISQVDVAKECGEVSPTAVYQVIQGNSRSQRIEMCIARITGLKLAELWPQWHGPKSGRRPVMSTAQVADALRARAG